MPQEKKRKKLLCSHKMNSKSMNEKLHDVAQNCISFSNEVYPIYKYSSIAYFDFTIVIFPFSFEEF